MLHNASIRAFIQAATWLFACLALLVGAAPSAIGQDTREVTFEGFDLKDGRPLFRGLRTIQHRGERVAETVVYTDLAGRETQRLEAEYEQANLALVKYRRVYAGSSEWETIERVGDRIRMAHQEVGEAKPETKELDWQERLVFSIVIAPRIQRARETLIAGVDVSFDLIVPSRLDAYRFRVLLDKPARVAGQPAWVARMEPTSFLIRQLVDPLYFYFADDGSNDLLEYRGRTAVHDEQGKSIDARVVYRYANPG